MRLKQQHSIIDADQKYTYSQIFYCGLLVIEKMQGQSFQFIRQNIHWMTLFKVYMSEYSWEIFQWWCQLPIFTFVVKDFMSQMIEKRNLFCSLAEIVNMCL